ncbi:MAG: hypothetical protein ACREYE_14460, partial [Gammaproteobacteria bacterium]
LGISRSGGARNPHVFQYTLRFLRSGGTRPSFARDGFFTNSQAAHWSVRQCSTATTCSKRSDAPSPAAMYCRSKPKS